MSTFWALPPVRRAQPHGAFTARWPDEVGQDVPANGATLTSKSREMRGFFPRSGPARGWHDTCSTTRCGPYGRRLPSRSFEHYARQNSTDVRITMLWTLFVVLLLLWVLGVVSSYTLGGFIHLLLVLAVIAVLVQLISGRRVV
jgi:hypothetical protein